MKCRETQIWGVGKLRVQPIFSNHGFWSFAHDMTPPLGGVKMRLRGKLYLIQAMEKKKNIGEIFNMVTIPFWL